MEDFKGSPGEWKQDIGADKMNHGLIRVMVSSSDTGYCPAYAFGESYEEAMANAKLVAQAKNAIKALQDFTKMYEDIRPAGGYQGVYDFGIQVIADAI